MRVPLSQALERLERKQTTRTTTTTKIFIRDLDDAEDSGLMTSRRRHWWVGRAPGTRYLTYERGRFTVSLYGTVACWTWRPHWHARPCCYFWVEWGPFVMGMVR
jgi:hypothetical protein